MALAEAIYSVAHGSVSLLKLIWTLFDNVNCLFQRVMVLQRAVDNLQLIYIFLV